MGCYERTLALLLEKYAGAMPHVACSRAGAECCAITDRTASDRGQQYAMTLLKAAGLRAETGRQQRKDRL